MKRGYSPDATATEGTSPETFNAAPLSFSLCLSLSFALSLSRTSLVQDQRSEIFQLATREISHMLADNLLVRFKASALYKELVGDTNFQEN